MRLEPSGDNWDGLCPTSADQVSEYLDRMGLSTEDRDTAIEVIQCSPELLVRQLLYRLGYDYRVSLKGLPSAVDLVLPVRRKVIEVRGCFWHGHDCGRCRIPATRRSYWLAKIARNRKRGGRTRRKLRSLGWDVLILWECQTRDHTRLKTRLSVFLGKGSSRDRTRAG